MMMGGNEGDDVNDDGNYCVLRMIWCKIVNVPYLLKYINFRRV